jgi:hypothetical protein
VAERRRRAGNDHVCPQIPPFCFLRVGGMFVRISNLELFVL